ncbi:helix-turn-helix domain-containing protein [Cellulophaga sp. BC115SP]|uniref:helix-turn-helix domain-containing protein n=1 Tax=Cellulophaga sp. BC115SP TaxID=2683263 RepID=UPI001412D49F|nr:helix-turn-helix transcriptional regulator [Cellulophaga sp. BC115SP]NBB27134.1 helix-turn-helix domain-containing protein [Cellulophaga sp. BC115SP]
MFNLKKLRQTRLELGFKQSYISHLTGIPQSTISRIEKGERSPTIKEVSQIIQVLNIKPIDLIE